MTEFTYRDGELCCENVSLGEIARHAGTPCFIYSKQALLNAYLALDKAFSEVDHLICYASKAMPISLCSTFWQSSVRAWT